MTMQRLNFRLVSSREANLAFFEVSGDNLKGK